MSEESMKYSLRNLKHRKGRSFLTIFSILIGITTIFIFLSFGLGLFTYIEEISGSSSVDKVIIQAKTSAAPGLDDTFKLTEDDLEVIESTAGVYEASGSYFKVGEAIQKDTRRFVFVVSIDPKNDLMMEVSDIEVVVGRELKSGEGKKAVLGYNYQFDDNIFPKGLEINDEINVQGEDLRVIGFYSAVGNPQDDSNIYITEDYLEELYPGENSYGMIVAKVDVSNMDEVIERIEHNLRKERNLDEGKEDFFVQSFEELIDSYSSALNIVIFFIILIALISVIVSAINTANTMITSVLERYKEIGVIKSLGARNSEILRIFLFESAFLGFVSGVFGVFIGYLITSFAGKILEDLGWGFLSPYYSWELLIGCVLFATVTGAVSGVLPAIRASKTNIVDALRTE